MAKDQKLKLPFITKISLTVITAFNDKVSRSNGTINRRLVRLFDFFRYPPISRSIKSVSSSDFIVDSSRDLWFRLFTPKKTSPSNRIPVIFYFHGGAFVLLGPSTPHYDSYCRRLARKLPAYVISINYRLAPEHRFPSQIDDGFDAVKFIDENHGSVLPSNADLRRCFLAGDSAGGNIAHHVAIQCCRNRFTAVKIIGQISIQPFFGGEERTEAEKQIIGTPLVSVRRTDWFWKAYLPVGCNRDHEAANVGGPNSVGITNLDFPETLVIVGGFDPLKDWGRRYYEWIKLSGKGAMLIEYPNMCHAFYLFSEVPESGELIQRIKEFVTAEPMSSLTV